MTRPEWKRNRTRLRRRVIRCAFLDRGRPVRHGRGCYLDLRAIKARTDKDPATPAAVDATGVEPGYGARGSLALSILGYRQYTYTQIFKGAGGGMAQVTLHAGVPRPSQRREMTSNTTTH